MCYTKIYIYFLEKRYNKTMSEQVKKALAKYPEHPLPYWDEFPNFEVYMDQLVNIGNRYLQNFTDTELTRSMINSYVKKNIMEKPLKKKYNASHIAEILVISLLKSIYPLEVIKIGINEALQVSSIEEAYNEFAELFNQTFANVKNGQDEFKLNHNDSLMKSTELFAIHAVIYRLISQKLIIIHQENTKKD